MGPLGHEFFEGLSAEFTARGASAPAGFGVTYPAVRVGEGLLLYPVVYRDSIEAGAENLRTSLRHINDICAESGTNIVLFGVSQGADVINTALSFEQRSGTQDFRNVASVVMFGDPSRSATQAVTQVGATQGEGFFRLFPIGDGGQDGWMRSNPSAVVSVCIPGDNVCNPAESPDDAENVSGTNGVSPFDRHQAYHGSDIALRCTTPSVTDGQFVSGKDCGVAMVADRLLADNRG
ncbi:hypothetical protein GCM10011410_20600 [Hoyosella rhizosphaerae]|uniref:Cutinase family protein n=2 Tax=Hoyosella rhizosphaerae TaxID=1755582 RepID=A0A916UE92_9ACTN|nr:hypothetical protein GCM10011410_20600 [Hoyosella rhizosphaerae]